MSVSARIFVIPDAKGAFLSRLQYSEVVRKADTEQAAADAIVARHYGPKLVAVEESYDSLTRKRTYRIEERT